MSKVQTLRVFITQRLTAAAEEICELFERTLAEYEEEQRTLLDAVLKPAVQIHRSDVQQLLVRKEEVPPEQQDWSPSLDQEDPPEPPHIKEEQEELWTSQEEQLRGLVEADIINSSFTGVPVKSEDDEEKHLSSQLHQRQTEHMKTGADEEDCGGPEPARNSDPGSHLPPATHDQTSHSCGPQTDDRKPQSGLNPLQNHEEPVSDYKCSPGRTSLCSSERATSQKGRLRKHNGRQTGVKPFSCSVCGKRYSRKDSLLAHTSLHTEGKTVSCSVCKKTFPWRGAAVRHMKIHMEEKPFSCSVCGKGFVQKSLLTRHLTVHTGEKPFSCSVCGKRFTQCGTMRRHLNAHTREKPFSCSV